MKQEDVTQAIEFIKNKDKQDYITTEEYYHIFKYHGEAIRKALRFLEAALGEPSQKAIKAGHFAFACGVHTGYGWDVDDVFKAMTEQMLKEIEEK
jgi:hypothetical protein